MNTNKTPKNSSQEKLEVAQKIAARSKNISKSYANFENALVYVVRWLSSVVNKILFNKYVSKIFALVLAILMYVSVNVTEDDSSGITQSATLNNIPVQAIYNSEIYEVTGIPESVDVIVTGDMSDITFQKGKNNSKVSADLSGLTEGTYDITLEPTNFSNELAVYVLDTPTIVVTISKKMTTKYNISYEYINTGAMDPMYICSTNPTFDSTEVLIRGSENTLNSIAFVKALIDVSGVTADFTKEAKVVAYDNNGAIVNCDIIPDTVNVTVAVSSPSKELPIIIRPVGTPGNALAIDSITLDYAKTTVYAPVSILDKMSAIYVDVDVSGLTKDTSLSTTVSLPSGVSKMSVTKINMEIHTAEKVTKTIENVKVAWINFDQSYKLKVVNEDDAYVSVVVSGTNSNIANITAADITAQIDLAGLGVGTHAAPISATGTNSLVDYQIVNNRTTIDVVISNN